MTFNRAPAGGSPSPRVLVLGSAVSESWGGEAVLPLHVFRGLRRRGVEAWISSADLNADEVRDILGDEAHRWLPVRYGFFERCCTWLWRRNLPLVPRDVILFPAAMLTQFRQRRVVRRAAREFGVNVAHQVIPISPRLPTALDARTVPLVLGPLAGGMDYPPGFRSDQAARDGMLRRRLRRLERFAHSLLPAARRAACVMVVNDRTLLALPYRPRGLLLRAPENGIDGDYWRARTPRHVVRPPGEPIRFVFIGALSWLKGCQWAFEALARVNDLLPAHLDIVGKDYGMGAALERQVRELGLSRQVTFHGFLPRLQAFEVLREGDVFVLPSIRESTGTVLIEAMAAGKPVIAVRWGGPANYVSEETGILVDPDSPGRLVEGLAEAMLRLGGDPELRARMGAAGRRLALERFTWEQKVERLCELYAALARGVSVELRASASVGLQ